MKILFKKLNSRAKAPRYMSDGAAGGDLEACLDAPVSLAPGERTAISTGLAVQIPVGYEIQVRPRSGLAFKQGVTLVNSPGTIDCDYRGEIKVLVINLGHEKVTFHHGDRIAQMVVQRVETVVWEEVEELTSTERAEGGFGSTGLVSGKENIL